MQHGPTADRHQLAAADHEADPGVVEAQRQVLQRAAVRRRAGRDAVPAHAVRLVAQPDSQRPRFRLDRAHRHPQQPGDRRHRPALDQHGERHYHHNHVVQALGLRHPGSEQKAAQQDRHSALQAGPQHERALVAPQSHRCQHEADQHRSDEQGQRHRQHQPHHPDIARRQGSEVDGEAQDQKGDDLAQAGQGGVEALDLPLVRRAAITDDDAGDKDGQEPGTVRHRRQSEQGHRGGEGPQWVEPLTGQGHPAHEPQQRPTAEQAHHGAHRHLGDELGGWALLWFMRRVALPSEGLYPLRTLAAAMALFGLATVAHGSGFLAVFVAGIVISDGRAPYKGEIERFHSALASLGEIVAFLILGLTVDLTALAHRDVWVMGLVLAMALALLIRPVLIGLVLAPVRLRRNERAFVLWAGLKGAMPILLGSFLLTAGVPQAQRLYDVIVVVVAFSVLVQGGSVPTVARLLRVPMRTVEPEPWALGVRLRDEPHSVRRYRVTAGSPADGSTLEDLTLSFDDAWICFVVRGGELVPVRGRTVLHAGDELLVLADPEHSGELTAAFSWPRPRDGA